MIRRSGLFILGALVGVGCAGDPVRDENFPTTKEGLHAAIAADRARIEEIVSQPHLRDPDSDKLAVLTPELVELNVRLIELSEALEAIEKPDRSTN